MYGEGKRAMGFFMAGLIRVSYWGLVWLVLLGLGGCATQPIVMQEIITVTGRGYARDFTAPVIETPSRYMKNLWANLFLEARGTAKPHVVIANPLQRRLMAQLDARSSAKRALAQKVEELKVTEDITLAEYLQTYPALRPQVEALIWNAELVQEDELPDGIWSVRVKMKLAALAELIRPPQELPEPSEQKQTLPQTTGEKAEAQAVRNARERLMYYIAGLEIQSGTSVFEWMRQDPRFFQHVVTMVQNAPIIDTRYPDDGVCEVDLEFDLAEIRALFH